MQLNRKSFKKMFPNLAREVGSGDDRVSIDSVKMRSESSENIAARRKFSGYVPNVVDFLRRCDTVKQAEEIIVYMEKRGEIDKQYARKLRKQLTEEGVRSFGTKKEPDYYLNHGEC
jgi:hypothetical protein